MNRGIYASTTGMLASQRYLDVLSNNLANSSTNGFKQDGLAFNDAMIKEMRANGGAGISLGTLGTGATEKSAGTDFSQGNVQSTGNPLDFAINGAAGMFAVQTPTGTQYTRDGAFAVTDGQLTTKDGKPILDDRGSTIAVDASKQIKLGEDGTVTVGGVAAGKLGLYQGKFLKEGGNLYSSPDATLMDPGVSSVVQGSIEGSNVNSIQSMVEIIRLGRSYEMSQKSIQSQDELTQKLIQSLQS